MPGARSSISIKKIPVNARGVKAIETAGKGLFSKESQPAQRLLREAAIFRPIRIEKPYGGAGSGMVSRGFLFLWVYRLFNFLTLHGSGGVD